MMATGVHLAENFRPLRLSFLASLRLHRRGGSAALVGLAAAGVLLCSAGVAAQSVLPLPETTGQTKVGRTAADSAPARWPQGPAAPEGAPNVLVILTDDVGFGSSSAFGGIIPTPTLDALAQRGLRYNQFNTAALCSPTRAALLTGREPHNAGMGNASNVPTGYAGYTSVIPKSVGMIAETLRGNGES